MSKLYVVGIGPGGYEQMTVKAVKVLEECDIIVGYTVYVDLVAEHFAGKEMLTTPMRQEEKRCRMAFDEVMKGRNTAMICSGDAGVYGMSGLIYEISRDYPGIEIEIVSGVTAALSGGAVLGAPLMHDFAVISLSDRLSPWETIEKRLLCAAEADLTIVLYNPASHGRPEHLHRACGILLRVLPEDRLCGIVRCIGREGESRRVLTLGELKTAQADMFCTVFIGNAAAQAVGGNFITPRGYRDV